MPSTNQSGDPETTTIIPQVKDEEKPTVKKTNSHPKTNPGKPKTEK